MSSKLPLNQDYYGSALTEYGSDNLYRVDGDVGGKIAPGALFRIYGSVNGADTQQTFGKRRRDTVSAAARGLNRKTEP